MSTPTDSGITATPQARPAIGRNIPDMPLALARDYGQPLGATSADSTNSGMSVGSQVTVGTIKPVDRKTITGSTPGDFRKGGDSAKAAMDQIANPPAPREQMRGQQNSRSYNENGKAFQSTENVSDSDAGN